jgi:branched-chain amino acid transport system permease protein
MNFDIVLFLLQDGVINAAIYALLGLSLILIFTVTRVISLPQGEFVSYGALTLAAMQRGLFPNTIYLVVILGIIAAGFEIVGALRAQQRISRRMLAFFLLYPSLLLLLLQSVSVSEIGLFGQILLTFAIVVPLGPMIYRTVFQPLADTPVLILLIAAVATHLVLVGVGLLVFGPEGSRTIPLSNAVFQLGPMIISGQSLVVVGVSIMLMLTFGLLLSGTMFGKALRATAVNRAGARIVGIRPEMAGLICFCVSAAAGVLSGILISPLTTIYYDSGFVVALKGFVAAIIGGLFSYPIALAGALFLGILEAFASFWASAYREVIVFSIVIPVLLVRSLTSKAPKEDAE